MGSRRSAGSPWPIRCWRETAGWLDRHQLDPHLSELKKLEHLRSDPGFLERWGQTKLAVKKRGFDYIHATTA